MPAFHQVRPPGQASAAPESGRSAIVPIADIAFRCDAASMRRYLPLALFAIGAAPVDHPRTYLLSIGAIPLRDTESVEAFSLETWGVEFRSVCRIPSGWRIEAGSGGTPNGALEGTGSQGATWFSTGSPRELRDFVLVTLYAPVQRADVATGTSEIPATFKGTATISTDDGDVKRDLSYRNVTLRPAAHCFSR